MDQHRVCSIGLHQGGLEGRLCCTVMARHFQLLGGDGFAAQGRRRWMADTRAQVLAEIQGMAISLQRRR